MSLSYHSDKLTMESDWVIVEVNEEIKEQDKEIDHEDFFLEKEEKSQDNSPNFDTDDTNDQSGKTDPASVKTRDAIRQKISCANCSEQILIEDVSQFEIGQHLSMRGGKKVLNKLYQHHAILKRVVSTFETVAELEVIHFYYKDDKELQIVDTIEKYDVKQNEIYYIKYKYPCYERDVVVARAEHILTESKELFKKYNVLSCNCEHFATWCVLREGECLQVQKPLQRIANTVSSKGLLQYIPIIGLITVPFGIMHDVMLPLNFNKYEQGNMCRSCLRKVLRDA